MHNGNTVAHRDCKNVHVGHATSRLHSLSADRSDGDRTVAGGRVDR